MEPVPKTLYSNELTQLIAREDYIESCRRESFKTYRIESPYRLWVKLQLFSLILSKAKLPSTLEIKFAKLQTCLKCLSHDALLSSTSFSSLRLNPYK
jgi:hypothetical protein